MYIMKKFYLLFALLLSFVGGSNMKALDLPTGIYTVGDEVASVETGKWYFLYNRGTKKYAKENTSGALKQAASPKGESVEGNEGYLVCLEEAKDGKYYIKTGLGNYYKGPSSSARGTGATITESWAMAITPIEDNPGHFILQGSTYNMIAPSSGDDLKGGTNKTANSIGDWAFVEVGTTTSDELTGRDLYNYQMSQMGLIRLKNKRTSTAYLTTNTAGSAVGAPKASNGLSQVWILEKSGAGYTLRSANTGQYLQDAFASPAANAKVLYFQFSPNNKGTESYCNISSASDFSGQSCLNLGNTGTSINKWSFKDDAGSDWAIELAEDVSEDDVRNNLNIAKGYVSELKDGSYYRIVCPVYNRYMTEADGNVQSINLNKDNYAQYWRMVKYGTGWAIQNVLTQNYVQIQTATSNVYRTGTTKVALYPRRTNDKWEYKWTIPNSNGGTNGLHTASGQGYNVVLWSTSADASVWAFQEVSLSEEDIEAAREALKEYDELVKNLDTYQAHLDNLFQDKACTTLKDNIQALTDEQLAANADFAGLNASMQKMVLKIKNNTWQQFTNKQTGYTADFERFFRIADYKIYSNHQDMAGSSNFRMSNYFGRLSGPTGIVADPGDIIYIYVNEDAKSSCQLKLETVTTDGVSGNHPTGAQSPLKKGLNVICPSQKVMLYIFHQLDDTRKFLADYPDIKIHIEGGQLNGYWDATRGMTNADWVLLQQDLLKASPFLNLKTEHLVFQMDANLVKQAEPKEMEGLMRIWDRIPANEDRYMGVEDFEGRFNNIWNVFSGASSYMHSTTYGTWYSEGTIPTIMNYENMRKPGSLWGPSHEIGHNHQASINVCGTTESSNNLFSNINTFEQGIQTSRCYLPNDNFNALASSITNNNTTYSSIPWPGRDIWNTTRMFFQLYLYFHVQHHDDQFLPNLFRMMRKKPFSKNDGWDSTTEFTYTEKGETKTGTGANITNGKNDYLHLAKMICDVAQADLSEFFESYGMFVPVKNFHVGDYANYLVTTTQADIDAAKAYMQKYPKKLGNIMFIDDHILPMKDANPDNIFEGLPPASGKKNNNLVQSSESAIGDVGDYEEFDGRTEYSTDGDYFTLSGSKVTFKGKDYIGHKFYDLDGNLIWATNAKEAELPKSVRALGVDNFIVVAAEPNMQDIPCPYFKNGTAQVYGIQLYFGNEEQTKKWWAGTDTDLAKYLPENAIGTVTSKSPSDNILSTPNIINEGTATSIVLNGDLPAYIPVETQAQSVKFTKTVDGMAALNLPFDVSNAELPGLQTATYDDGALNITSAETVTAGKPVVVNGNVALTLANATLKAGTYQQLTAVKVLAADGQSVVEAATASPFTFNMDDATAITAVSTESQHTQQSIYDLSGRRITGTPKAGLYIINGKKQIIK